MKIFWAIFTTCLLICNSANAENWQELNPEAVSQCLEKRELHCLIEEIAQLYNPSERPFDFYKHKGIINRIIQTNNQKQALRYLENWPSEEELEDTKIGGTTTELAKKEIALNIVAGDVERAKNLLVNLQSKLEWGGDYEVIHAIYESKNYDLAKDFLTLTNTFKKKEIKEHGFSSMHCAAQNVYEPYPMTVPLIVKALAKEQDFIDAVTLVDLVEQYISADFNNMDRCHHHYALKAFVDSNNILADYYLEEGKPELAEAAIQRNIDHILTEYKEEFRSRHSTKVGKVAFAAAYLGFPELIQPLITKFERSEGLTSYRHEVSEDPLAILYAYSGQTEKALARIANLEPDIKKWYRQEREKYQKQPNNILAELLSPSLEIPLAQIQITNLKLIINALQFLEHPDEAKVYLIELEQKYAGLEPKPLGMIATQFFMAEQWNKLGYSERANKIFNIALGNFQKIEDQKKERQKGTIFKIFYQLHGIEAALDWAKSETIDYSEIPNQSQLHWMTVDMIDNKDWFALESLVNEPTVEFKHGSGAPYNVLPKALLEAGKYDAYSKIVESLGEGKRAGWLSFLITQGLRDQDIPLTLLQKAWNDYYYECRFHSRFSEEYLSTFSDEDFTRHCFGEYLNISQYQYKDTDSWMIEPYRWASHRQFR